MTGLSKKVSQAVVNEIAWSLGESSAARAVGVTDSRLNALTGGRALLSDVELEQIFSITGKTWRTWLLGMAQREGVCQQILSPTVALVKSLNHAETRRTKTPKNSKRSRATRVV